MITISKKILSQAKKVHVNELSKQIEFKVRVINTALNFLNLAGLQHEIADLEKNLKALKIDFSVIRSTLNWFIKKPKEKEEILIKSWGTLSNFFISTNYRVTFTNGTIEEIKRCTVYFDNLRVISLLGAKPKDLIDFQVKDFEAFCIIKNSEEEKKIRGLLLNFLFNYSSFQSKTFKYDAYQLAKNLNVESCLYCNRSPANTVTSGKSKIIRPELDHFFPQHKYRILSLSFYNLIPSCHSCNSNLKGKVEFDLDKYFHPYLDSFDENYVLFKYRPYNEKDFFPNVDDNLRVKLITHHLSAPLKNVIDNNIEIFKLNDIYTSHEILIKQLQKLKRNSNKKYLDAIRTKVLVYNDGSPRYTVNKSVYEIVMLNYYKPSEYYKRPMAKFIKDISIDLKLI